MSFSDHLEEETVAAVPPLAGVAFAGRCVRRIIGALGRDEGDELVIETGAHQLVMTSIPRAVRAIENCGAKGELMTPSTAERLLSNVDADLMYHSGSFNWPNAGRIVGHIGHCLHSAIRASERGGLAEIIDTAKEALAVADAYSDDASVKVDRSQQFDFELLLEAFSESKGSILVPPAFFGSLWATASPVQWPSKERTSENRALILGLEIGRNASNEEVLDLVAALVTRLDAIHRAYGGHGLKVETGDIMIEEEANVPV
jgi:hypothetical protein